ncbi:MAG: hypothetical protein GX847_06945 [Clostridiales bacterium]|nr:hypothetical protein [Clostridiales bacterium]
MRSKSKRLAIAISVIAAALVFAIIGYIVLPDTLIMQITSTGKAGTTMPKALGLAIPLAISTLFSLLYYKSGIAKHFVGAAVGIVAFVLVFVFNL